MRTVKEVSKLTGVSVRTLHYYDAIGLLEPTKVTDTGYRMYDDTSLSRLQNILLFRELQFPLKEIKEILDSPNFNQEEAIAQQIKLLELQYKHIGELISFAREIQTKGVKTMNFEGKITMAKEMATGRKSNQNGEILKRIKSMNNELFLTVNTTIINLLMRLCRCSQS